MTKKVRHDGARALKFCWNQRYGFLFFFLVGKMSFDVDSSELPAKDDDAVGRGEGTHMLANRWLQKGLLAYLLG